ncbi:MAG: sensor histidine kinase, partial [Chitinophagales bacterium]|nr:sensor histidine kinase [Chitinophagales bacterium]
SIEFYRKGLTLAQKTNDPKLITILSNNLAETYQSSNRSTELVQRYLMLALDNSKQSKNWPAAGMNAANLALEFAKLGQTRKAEIVLKESIDLMNRNSAKSYQYGTTCHVLSSVFYELGDMSACIQYAKISIQIMDSLKQPDNALRPMTNLAHAYVRLKDISNAQLYATRLLSDAKKRNAKLYIRDGYKTLAEIAELKGDTKLALEHYKRYKTYNDSIFEINRERNITNMEAMAALSKNEQEIKFKTMQQSLENKNLKNQNSGLQKQRMLILILCIIFAVLIVMLYKSNREVSTMNNDLEKAKARVEKQVVEKEIMVKEIHHRVKNNLTMLKGLLYLQAKSSNHKEAKTALEECQLRIENMALVHQKLYDENNIGKLNFLEFLETMFDQLNGMYKDSKSHVELELSGVCSPLNVSTAIPLGLMMNELITNSFKYAFEQIEPGRIQINVEESAGVLKIRYSDNGPGLKEPLNLNMGGFGFKLLDIFAEQLSATISNRKEELVSTFIIEIPSC